MKKASRKQFGAAVMAPYHALRSRSPIDRSVDVGLAVGTGLVTGNVNNIISEARSERKQKEKATAAEIASLKNSIAELTKPKVPKAAGLFDKVKGYGNTLVLNPIQNALMAENNAKRVDIASALQAAVDAKEEAELAHNMAHNTLQGAQGVFSLKYPVKGLGKEYAQQKGFVTDAANLTKAENEFEKAKGLFAKTLLKHDNAEKALAHATILAEREAATAGKISKGLAAFGGAFGIGAAGKEIAQYPSWRRAAKAETSAIYQGLKKVPGAGLSRGQLIGLSAGAIGLGAALTAGAVYNARTERTHPAQRALPYIAEDAALDTLASTSQWEQNKAASYFRSPSRIWPGFPPENAVGGASSELAGLGKNMKRFGAAHPVLTGVGAAALTVAALGAHQHVKDLGGYNEVAHKVAPGVMQKVDAIAGVPHAPKPKGHGGKILALGAAAAGGAYVANKLGQKKTNQVAQMAYNQGLQDGAPTATAKQASQAMHIYQQNAGVLPEGYVSIEDHPEFKEEKSASVASVIAEDIKSGGQLYEDFLKSKTVAAQVPKVNKIKNIGLGILTGLALPVVGKGAVMAANAVQQARLQNQMYAMNMQQQMMPGYSPAMNMPMGYYQ